VLPEAKNARREQSALRTDERRVRLHPDQGRFPELSALRLRFANFAGGNDRRNPDRKRSAADRPLPDAGTSVGEVGRAKGDFLVSARALPIASFLAIVLAGGSRLTHVRNQSHQKYQ